MHAEIFESDLDALRADWSEGALAEWLQLLPNQLEQGFDQKRFGDLARWLDALEGLPTLVPQDIQLNTSRVGCSGDISPAEREQLTLQLMGLHPWRKGPFELFNVHIDTEWRSDWKWDRLIDSIDPLEGRRVLDVGCGSGYHCWRMLGAGARQVIGIEPTPLFIVQFKAIQCYLNQPGVHLLPLTMEQLPRPLNAFDTVFSMGVLYHRRSPFDHLLELRDSLTPGGQLVLETLVIEGGEQEVLVPEGRYAKMGNVWFLPTTHLLMHWLRKLSFVDIVLVDVNQTQTTEQRSTPWMTFHSLAEFLDPSDPERTIEGHPAPRRAILTARAP